MKGNYSAIDKVFCAKKKERKNEGRKKKKEEEEVRKLERLKHTH